MNWFSKLRHKQTAATIRLARIRAFNDIIQRLTSHRCGKSFMVNTAGLSLSPPFIEVTERFSKTKLQYAGNVSAVVMYNRMRHEIIFEDETLKYIIKQ